MQRRLVYGIVTLLFSVVAALGQAPRGLHISDLARMREASDAQLSPDGKTIAFVVSETSADRARSIAHIWLVPTQGGEVRRLTNDEASEAAPRWSPDGQWLAFYSDRDKQNGLWVIPAAGGAAKLVAHLTRTNFFLTHAGESFTWAPDSKRLAFLASPEILNEKPVGVVSTVTTKSAQPASGSAAPTGQTQAGQSQTGQGSQQAGLTGIPEQLRRPLTREEINQLPTEVREMILRLQAQVTAQTSPATPNPSLNAPAPATELVSQLANDPRVVTRLQYKARTTFADNLQSHIFVADLATGQLKQLTEGSFYEHSINWSPKADEIVFVSNREAEPDKVNNTDLFVINVNTRLVRQLTKTKGCEWTPVFSPDGKDIAFTGTQRAITTIDSVAEDTHVFLISAQADAQRTDAIRELNKEQDRRVFAVRWSPDGAFVLFTATDQGRTLLYQATRLGSVKQLFDYEAQIGSFSVAANGAMAISISDATHPSEIYATRAPGQFGPVTKLNQEWLGTFQPVQPREFSFNHEGMKVQGWVYPPVGLVEGKKYPVVLSIHGGPHGMHGYAFNPNTQILAAQGYAVVLINPRGSSGYGQRFSDGCVNDWGGGDYRDLMKGVDEAATRFAFLDTNRMGVMGGSYGGYMTNWVVTQTNRFKAAVTMASLSNLISFYSTSLYQDLIHAEFNGYPWENFDLLWERSPLKHIKKAQTPTLIIHGEQDNDVHITQAEEFYTALRMRGVESVFVRYPREGHGIREPRHREDQLARTVLWFDRLLKPAGLN